MVALTYQNKKYTFKLKKPTKAKDLLNKMNVNAEVILIFKNKKIITEEDFIENKDKISLLKIVSGG